MPYQAIELGQGQDPSLEPRVEVIRRLIAYPNRTFRRVVETLQALDSQALPVRWLCYRDPGKIAARPYWMCFVSSRPGGRRFHIGLELFDRAKLGLWFFSGYDATAVAAELLAPFPARPDVSLPRLELSDAEPNAFPIEEWLKLAWNDELRFAPSTARFEPTVLDTGEKAQSADQSLLLDPSIRSIVVEPNVVPILSLRSSRARLAVGLPGENGKIETTLWPISRLSTSIGRDPRCDIVLDHRNVSMEHCKITWRNGVPGLEELGSKNGTVADTETVRPEEPHILPNESRLLLGGIPCLFVQDDPEGKEGMAQRRTRVEALVKQRKLSREEADSVYAEAEDLGVSPGEILLKRGHMSLMDWAPKKGGMCGTLFKVALLGLVLLGAAAGGLAVWASKSPEQAESTLWWVVAQLSKLLVILTLTGCHSFGIPPIYQQELEPTPMREDHRRIEWDYEIGVRPLFMLRENEEQKRTEHHILFPLGKVESDTEQRTLRLYPLFQRIERTDPDGFQDTDNLLFPFIWAGHHPVEGGYFYLFPFGGTLKGLLGKDEAAGVLFPLYGWARRGETESHHILFPLISWSEGPETSGLRILPFYSHQEKKRDGELVFNRTSIMWPFINWADEKTNSHNPSESLFIFPFYGWTRSRLMDDTVILWPLFRWWHDKQSGYKEYRLPFPLLIYGDGPDHSRMDLWPLVGFRQRGDYKRHFFLWPIERWEYLETEEYVDERLWILPVFWTHTRTYKNEAGQPDPELGEDHETTVFPLARWEYRRDGFAEVRIPAPLWFRGPLRNWETILSPLWTLFRWTRDHEGTESTSVLLGAWSSRSTPQGEERWDILGGLVGYTSTPEGEGRLRLLWLLEF